jgi:hypothetical protein
VSYVTTTIERMEKIIQVVVVVVVVVVVMLVAVVEEEKARLLRVQAEKRTQWSSFATACEHWWISTRQD